MGDFFEPPPAPERSEPEPHPDVTFSARGEADLDPLLFERDARLILDAAGRAQALFRSH